MWTLNQSSGDDYEVNGWLAMDFTIATPEEWMAAMEEPDEKHSVQVQEIRGKRRSSPWDTMASNTSGMRCLVWRTLQMGRL